MRHLVLGHESRVMSSSDIADDDELREQQASVVFDGWVVYYVLV